MRAVHSTASPAGIPRLPGSGRETRPRPSRPAQQRPASSARFAAFAGHADRIRWAIARSCATRSKPFAPPRARIDIRCANVSPPAISRRGGIRSEVTVERSLGRRAAGRGGRRHPGRPPDAARAASSRCSPGLVSVEARTLRAVRARRTREARGRSRRASSRDEAAVSGDVFAGRLRTGCADPRSRGNIFDVAGLPTKCGSRLYGLARPAGSRRRRGRESPGCWAASDRRQRTPPRTSWACGV
jgi:hypothetical protein